MGRIVIIATIDLNVVPKTRLSSATPRLVLVIVGTYNGYFPLVTHYGVSAKTVLKERSFFKKNTAIMKTSSCPVHKYY